MVIAVFVAPYLLDATARFAGAAARLPGVELALVTCEPEDHLPPGLRRSLAAHWQIGGALDAGQIATAVQGLGAQIGPPQRLLGVLEQLQVPLAQVREQLGIAGMDVATAHNFPRQGADEVGAARRRGAVRAAPAGRFRGRSGRLRGRSRLPAGGQAAHRGRC